MNEKKLKASKNQKIKFSPLEMEDRFADGDHSHDEFNYRSQVQTDDAVNTTLISNTASPIATENIASGGSSDPHAHGLGGDLKSAVLGIVKGMVGPAILYLPHGFAHAGWLIAVPMLLASTALFLASSSSLLECWEIETQNNKRMLEMKDREDSTGAGAGHQTVLEMRELRNNATPRNNVNIDADPAGSGSSEEFDNEFLEGALVAESGGNSSYVTTPSYPDLAKKAFGHKGQTIVKIGIAAMQSGVCLTYLIFVPQNMRTVWEVFFEKDVSTSYFLFVMVLVQIPFSWIREIRLLTVTNALANSLIMYGLITCLGFAFQEAILPVPGEDAGDDNVDMNDDLGNDEDSQRGALAEIAYKFFHLPSFNEGWFLFIGTSVLLFEGSITLLIPLQEAVATPQDRQYFPKMYPNVILCIIWFYTFFGIFCWMSFGSEVHTVLTTSLPETNLATTVQLAYSLAVMLTFPLQNFPSLEIACKASESLLLKVSASSIVRSNNKLFGLVQIFQRREVITSLIVCFLALVAILTMDHLDKVVSLMGGLLGCPLAFVFPPLIHNKLASMPGSYVPYNLSRGRRLRNKIVAALGLCAMIVATITTIMRWSDDD